MKTAPLCHALAPLFSYCAVECDRLSSDVRTWAINAQLDFACNWTSQYVSHDKLVGLPMPVTSIFFRNQIIEFDP
jgi:hypothetical protein